MTNIKDFVDADVPYEDVPHLAERYLDSFPTNAHGGSHFTLRAWFANVLVEREVMLKAVPIKTEPRCAVLEVSWHPVSGPYPSFHGKLYAWRGDTRSCRLEIEGNYEPPGGIAGAAFDAILGHRIAAESIHDLLDRFKDAFADLHAAEVH
ncbi:MAG: hypothetical protein ABSH03_02435 [Candidatus Lustribacter sp.]|jgi:uncharacterized membrane protein